MMQIIFLVIFLISLFGLAFVLYKKIPMLVTLPRNGHHGFKKPEFISKIEKRVKDTHFHFFEKQMLLHKLLSKLRIWVLKTERKIGEALYGIRKKAQQLDKEVRKKR